MASASTQGGRSRRVRPDGVGDTSASSLLLICGASCDGSGAPRRAGGVRQGGGGDAQRVARPHLDVVADAGVLVHDGLLDGAALAQANVREGGTHLCVRGVEQRERQRQQRKEGQHTRTPTAMHGLAAQLPRHPQYVGHRQPPRARAQRASPRQRYAARRTGPPAWLRGVGMQSARTWRLHSFSNE